MVATQGFISFPQHSLPRPTLSSSSSSSSSSSPFARGFQHGRNVPGKGARLPLRVRASDLHKQPPPSSSSSSSSLQTSTRSARPSLAPGPHPNLQTVSVEDQGVSVEGVARVEIQESARPSWGRLAVLAGGDVLMILAFAAIGRLSHGIPVFDWDTLKTADPFIAGWLLGSYFLGGYGPEGQGVEGFRSAMIAASKSWVVGIPLGLTIRSATTGHAPAQAFILVSLGSTFVLLVGWRAALTTLLPNDDRSKKTSGDRQGSFFELFELLASLIKRW